jgi:CheY-like chemotaxis protein
VNSSKLSVNPITFLNGKVTIEFLNTDFSSDTHYLLLLDINMPIMNGWEVLDAIENLEKKDNISTIIITSSINYADKEMASKYSHVISYIEKPLSEGLCKEFKTLPPIDKFF